MVSPSMEYRPIPPATRHHTTNPPPTLSSLPKPSRISAPALSRATSWSGVWKREGSSTGTPALIPTISNSNDNGHGSQNRLQATFQAIKKMSAGLSSPRFDYSPRRERGDSERGLGYFNVTTEEHEDES